MIRAVVLARGLGTRMRARNAVADLTPEQARAADAGLKAMMPLNGRPFLDYVLSAIADASVAHVGLIVAPDHTAIREYYENGGRPTRVHLDYIVQPEALGTANALLAAESWCGSDPFLVLNADNLYPVAVLSALASLDEPGLAVFRRDALLRESNIPPERTRAFAVVESDRDARGIRASGGGRSGGGPRCSNPVRRGDRRRARSVDAC
jgi:NDP-sugar pyrophosphorylase family protein